MSTMDKTDSQDAQASMPSLDDQLREILKSASISGIYGDTHEATYLELIAQIHQSFQDAEYYRLVKVGKFIDTSVKRMTGEEWYKRFEQELENHRGDFIHASYQGSASSALKLCMEAAKRAAGLDT